MSVGVPRDEPTSDGHDDRAESARLEAEVRRIRGRAAFASEASISLLSASLDLDQIIERLIRLAVPELGDGCVVYLADARGELRMPVGKHLDSAKDAVLHRFLSAFVPDPSKTMLYEVFRTAKTFYVAEITEDLLRTWGQTEDELVELRKLAMRSVVIVPMVAHGRSIGVLTVGTTGDRVFAKDDIAAVTDLGEKAGLAIDNANLYAGEHRARMRTELLQVLTTDLARALTSEEIADVITHHGLAVGADAAAIWEVDASGGWATFIQGIGDCAGWDRHASVTLEDDTTVAHVLSRNVPLFIDSPAEYEKAFRTPEQRIPAWGKSLTSFAFLPLVVGEQRLGALVFAFKGERPPGPDERALLLVAAGHAAQALYRARLYEAERRSREEVGLLYDLLDAFNKAETVAEVFEPAIDAVQLGLGVTRSSILLFDDQGVMRFRAWRGLSDEYRRAVEGHSPWPLGTIDPYPVQVPDVRADPSLQGFIPLFEKEGICACAFRSSTSAS
ncbi:MAG: GAF domain-containing protein [Polyangiaceae bacterium]|nr:GAF domain-containing protein [Polyangiaceae bacterium]